jgi:protoporphyrinogen oxidase
MGFAETLQKPMPPSDSTLSFRAWALATFGRGICDHFMLPYNQKLFCSDLESMTADWVSWSIPKPSWVDVVRGAQGTNKKSFGYNATFLYPLSGGIDHVPNAFVPSIRPPALGVSLVAVDARDRCALLSDGRAIRYSKLISTIPLPQLLGRIEGLPADVAQSSKRLRHVSVLNLNFGFDRPCIVPYQWIYFPEPDFPFYRVGVYSNLSAAAVPSGRSAFYVEISHLPTDAIDVEELTARSIAAMRRIGLIPADASLCRNRPVHIEGAYVIHDRDRQCLLPMVHEILRSRDILSTGRYGAWEYSAMEDAIWEGRQAAEWARS